MFFFTFYQGFFFIVYIVFSSFFLFFYIGTHSIREHMVQENTFYKRKRSAREHILQENTLYKRTHSTKEHILQGNTLRAELEREEACRISFFLFFSFFLSSTKGVYGLQNLPTPTAAALFVFFLYIMGLRAA
jgi:hypothetical protein